MNHAPNRITATLPAGLALMKARMALIEPRRADPRITMLHRASTQLTPITMLAAVDGSTLLTKEEITQVIEPMRRAADALRTGVGRWSDWVCLSSAVNISQGIERKGVVRGLADELANIYTALQAIGDRAGDTEAQWRHPTLYAAEITALNELVRWHKYQLQQLSYREYAQARDYSIAKVRSTGGQAFDVKDIS
jgi:hypothetical protein